MIFQCPHCTDQFSSMKAFRFDLNTDAAEVTGDPMFKSSHHMEPSLITICTDNTVSAAVTTVQSTITHGFSTTTTAALQFLWDNSDNNSNSVAPEVHNDFNTYLQLAPTILMWIRWTGGRITSKIIRLLLWGLGVFWAFPQRWFSLRGCFELRGGLFLSCIHDCCMTLRRCWFFSIRTMDRINCHWYWLLITD